MKLIDPVKFCKLCWPHVNLYDRQREILYSVRDNDETFVPAGNALGKDFVSALCALWFFCSRRPARVVTTSVKFDQLNDVLWGEIRRFLDTTRVRLPIYYNHMKIRGLDSNGALVPLCEIVGQVVNKGESLLGRHLPRDIPRTLAIFDEASGIDDQVYHSSDTWAHRKLIIGNPYPCTNFFFRGVKEGDLKAESNGHYYRKVIRVKADDSPNVQLARIQASQGREVSGEILVPGVIDWSTYQKRRELWDSVRQCIGLDAEFYEGAEVLLFPPDWLNKAEQRAEELKGQPRKAQTIGCDPAEGGDKTCWSVIDELGLIKLISMKTPDTSIIVNNTLALMNEYRVEAHNVLFDRGGGGKQHADRLRSMGHHVRTVAFGESVTIERQLGLIPFADKKEGDETKYVYRNRRAQMYGFLREALDPSQEDPVFALPAEYTELRKQLSPIPLQYDGEGRLELPPKTKRRPEETKVTLTELIGHSPDEADSLVLALYGIREETRVVYAGAI